LPSQLAAATDQHGTLGPAYNTNNINTIIANKTIYCNLTAWNIKVQLTSYKTQQVPILPLPKLMNVLNVRPNSNK